MATGARGGTAERGRQRRQFVWGPATLTAVRLVGFCCRAVQAGGDQQRLRQRPRPAPPPLPGRRPARLPHLPGGGQLDAHPRFVPRPRQHHIRAIRPGTLPGATNPAGTQATIWTTICRDGWTTTVRPPASYTEPIKFKGLAAYSEPGPVHDYEEDHLIPRELGGSPTSKANLWPEPGAAPNLKDHVENAANRAVCDQTMTLQAAREAIAGDWIALGKRLGVLPAATPGPGTSQRRLTRHPCRYRHTPPARKDRAASPPPRRTRCPGSRAARRA